jgi:Lon protease-like protein
MSSQSFPNLLDVPLFPLPGIVLFPGSVLPLRVFEPRYVALLRDALTGTRLIGMAQLKASSFPQTESEFHVRPPVYDVLGVGRIVAHEKLADGTSHIALLGQARVKIKAERPHEPYRIAQVEALHDILPSNIVDREKLRRMVADIKKGAQTLSQRTLDAEAQSPLAQVLESPDPGHIADVLSGIFVHDHQLRQALLENQNVFARISILRELLNQMLGRAEIQAPRVKLRNDEICLN